MIFTYLMKIIDFSTVSELLINQNIGIACIVIARY